jgi:hypothetical protein
VFQLNTELFPSSVTSGTAWPNGIKSNDKVKAIEYYNKAIARSTRQRHRNARSHEAINGAK